jgi:hypothetical protein
LVVVDRLEHLGQILHLEHLLLMLQGLAAVMAGRLELQVQMVGLVEVVASKTIQVGQLQEVLVTRRIHLPHKVITAVMENELLTSLLVVEVEQALLVQQPYPPMLGLEEMVLNLL